MDKFSIDNRGNLYLKTVAVLADSSDTPTAESFSISDTQSMIFEFDGFNRMSGMETGGTVAEYEYNSDGLRTAKTVNGDTTDFVLDGMNVIAEITDGGVTNYVRGLTGIIYRKTPDGAKTYYITNNHGDVVQLVAQNFQVIQIYTYDEYGNVTYSSGNDSNPFLYCGEYYDEESGLIYLRARYYSPELGRFISEDPIRDDLNWYVYCGSNPINFWDPLGLADVYYFVTEEFLHEVEADADIICKKYGIEVGSEDFVVTVIKKPENLYVAWDNIDANTDAVFINMHGSQSELLLSSDKNAPSIDMGRLSGKTIDSVILLACFNGTQAGGYENVATQILDNNKINNGVIASVMPIYGKVVDEYKDDGSHLHYTRYRTEGNGFYIYTEERDNNNNYRRHRLREGMWATNTYTNVVVIINTASRVLENYKARKS